MRWPAWQGLFERGFVGAEHQEAATAGTPRAGCAAPSGLTVKLLSALALNLPAGRGATRGEILRWCSGRNTQVEGMHPPPEKKEDASHSIQPITGPGARRQAPRPPGRNPTTYSPLPSTEYRFCSPPPNFTATPSSMQATVKGRVESSRTAARRARVPTSGRPELESMAQGRVLYGFQVIYLGVLVD